MESMDRRHLLTGMLGVATAAAMAPLLAIEVAEAAPPLLDVGPAAKPDDWVAKAQAVIVGPRRRGRRRVCRWRRGRRVCTWVR